MVYGIWYVVYGIWYVVYGMVYCIWYMVYGIPWHGAWSDLVWSDVVQCRRKLYNCYANGDVVWSVM